MRKVSLKRQRLNRQVQPVRNALVEEIGVCEWCHKPECGPLDVDEISQGSSRGQSLQDRALVLVIGRPCHDVRHRSPDKRQIGLALIAINRPADYSLSRFWEVTGRAWPEQEEVDLWIRRLTQGSN